MPTSKPRITITATGDLERILEVEAALHPDLSPSELVGLLVRRGHAACGGADARRELVEALAGSERYPADHRRELRDEWPD